MAHLAPRFATASPSRGGLLASNKLGGQNARHEQTFPLRPANLARVLGDDASST